MSEDMGRILIVDDEINIRAGLRDVLVRDGHSVTEAGSGEEALKLLERLSFDVAIVDVRMPGMSGTELLEVIRSQWPYIAVIMLTGHGTLETAIVAVKADAHDYLLKPARADAIRQTLTTAIAASRRRKVEVQLLDSIRAGLKLLDRGQGEGADEAPSIDETHRLDVGELHINMRAHEVRRSGIPVGLSPTEFKLLVALATRPGEALDYGKLVQESMGYEAEPWEAKELIKRHVYALRHKIEANPAEPQYILNVRGIGYRLDSPI